MPPLPVPFEQALAAARADAPWGYEVLWTWLSPAVVGYLRRAGSVEPDDLVSEVFLGAFSGTGLARFRGDEVAFRSWVFTIAHRRLTDERRRRGRRPPPDALPADDGALGTPGPDTEQRALAHLGDDDARRLLDALAPDQRDVLLLRVFGDLTVEQVAGVLGKRPGAVKALQRRGLAALRRDPECEGVPLERPSTMTEV